MSSVSNTTIDNHGFSRKGKIELILGPMFSGKTTEMFRRIRIHSISTKKCIIIKYARDNRYDSVNACTHDSIKTPALACEVLSEVEKHMAGIECIGIDEGQFFPDVVEFCEKMANSGKIIIVSALDGDYKREIFPSIGKLIPKSESITKLSAVCMGCFQEAAFTRRKTACHDLIVIGSSDIYEAACRKCHIEHNSTYAATTEANE